MRKNKIAKEQNKISILTLDDDPLMTVTLQSYFQARGYKIDAENDPQMGIELIRDGRYDILLLDFLMTPICGDEVVSRIREFNRDLFIVLLTGHKSMAPPIKTIRELDIQGYYEKSDRFDQLELLVESCVKSIKHMRTIKQYQSGMSKIIEAAPKIYSLQPIETLLLNIAKNAGDITGTKEAFCALSSDHVIFKGTGEYERDNSIYKWAINQVKNTGRIFDLNNIALSAIQNGKHEVLGVLGAKLPDNADGDKMQLFALYAKQASSAVSNVLLHAIVNNKNEELNTAYEKLERSYMDMVSTIRITVDAKDFYTRGHSDRVSEYAVRIAKKMGKNEMYCDRIRVAGLIHDIGKLGTSDTLLQKDSKLTEQEFREIKNHPKRGGHMVEAVSMLSELAPIVRGHHERFDGKGYPDGLAGESICEEARIISIADAFDAMTSDRAYRNSLSLEQAINQLKENKDKQFDGNIVDVFIDILNDYEGIKKDLDWTFERQV